MLLWRKRASRIYFQSNYFTYFRTYLILSSLFNIFNIHIIHRLHRSIAEPFIELQAPNFNSLHAHSTVLLFVVFKLGSNA